MERTLLSLFHRHLLHRSFLYNFPGVFRPRLPVAVETLPKLPSSLSLFNQSNAVRCLSSKPDVSESDCHNVAQHKNVPCPMVSRINVTDGSKVGNDLHALMSSGAGKTTGRGADKDSDKRPNLDLLTNVQNLMIDQIPVIFSKKHEYRIYTKDLIFENNWNLQSPKKTVGISAYVFAVIKARIYVHSRYAKVKVTILSSSVDEARSCVSLRWRIAGLPQVKAFMFWKFLPFRFHQKAAAESEWLDGLSSFYVNKKGFIYLHVLDRVIPDDDKSAVKKSELGLGAS